MTFRVTKSITQLDSQIQEIISRNILINKLLEYEFEVAMPVRDCGIDLLVYKKLESTCYKKIQLKSSIGKSLSFKRNYHKITDLNFIFILGVISEKPIIYGLTISELIELLESSGKTYDQAGSVYWKISTKIDREKLNKFDLTEPGKFIDFFAK